MKASTLRTYRIIAPFCLCLLVLAAFSGCSDASSTSDSTDQSQAFSKQSVAFVHEDSDVSGVFLNEPERGFVTLRRSSGPVAYFTLADGRVARYEHISAEGKRTLRVGDASITLEDVDDDGDIEVVLESAQGSKTFEEAELELNSTSREQALMSLDELDQEIEQTLQDLANFHHDPRVQAVLKVKDSVSDVVQNVKDKVGGAIDDVTETISDWNSRDWRGNDRDLVSDEPVAVAEVNEESIVDRIFREIRDRLRDEEPETNLIDDELEERTDDPTAPSANAERVDAAVSAFRSANESFENKVDECYHGLSCSTGFSNSEEFSPCGYRIALECGVGVEWYINEVNCWTNLMADAESCISTCPEGSTCLDRYSSVCGGAGSCTQVESPFEQESVTAFLAACEDGQEPACPN